MSPEPSNESLERLRQECRTFTRYLCGRDPDDYVERKYVEGDAVVLAGASPVLAIDAQLTRFAAGGRVRARIADAYARIFRPHGLLRRKLIFLFAILENSKGFYGDFTAGGNSSLVVALARIGMSVAAFMLALAAGMLLFAPRQYFGRTAPGEVLE